MSVRTRRSWISWSGIRRKERAEQKARGPGGILVGTGIARDQGLQHRRRRYADPSIVPTAGSPSIVTTSKWAPALNGSQSGRSASGRVADEIALAQHIRSAGARHLRRPYTISQKTQDAAARNPRWVPAISTAFLPRSAPMSEHIRRPSHASSSASVWPAALELWRHRAERSQNPPTKTAVEDATGHAGLAPLLAGGRGKGACAQRRDWGDGARLQSLGMVAATAVAGGVDGRHRCLAVRRGAGKLFASIVPT